MGHELFWAHQPPNARYEGPTYGTSEGILLVPTMPLPLSGILPSFRFSAVFVGLSKRWFMQVRKAPSCVKDTPIQIAEIESTSKFGLGKLSRGFMVVVCWSKAVQISSQFHGLSGAQYLRERKKTYLFCPVPGAENTTHHRVLPPA